MLPRQSALLPQTNKSPVAHSSVWPTSSPESTDFLSGVSLIKISDLLQKGKKTRLSSSQRCKKAFLHLFSDPLELKYLPKFRQASPGVDWQVSHGPGGFAESPLFPAAVFLLLNCNLFELNSESKEPLAASAYLVDAKCGCRLSESLTICSFPQPAKTATGVPSYGALFRISPPLESEENTDGDVLITDMQAVFNTEQAQKLDGVRHCVNTNGGYSCSCRRLLVQFAGVFLVIQIERKLHTEEKTDHTTPLETNAQDLRSPFAWTAVNLAAVIAQTHITHCLPTMHEDTQSGALAGDARGKPRGRSQRMVDVFRRPHRSADASLSHWWRIRSASCCEASLPDTHGSGWMTSSNEDLTPVLKRAHSTYRSLSKDSNPRLSERPDMNTCGDQLFTSPYNRIIQLRSSRFFKVSSISFETISSAIAEVYRQERLAASQFDPLAGFQSLTGQRGSIIPSSVSPTSRSAVSPQSTTSTNPWLCPVENPERQSALRKMRIITSVSIALSLQVVTCENLAPFLREYLQGVDRGLGSMRLISPENKPYCLAREPSWGQSLRNLAVESDSSAASLEPSVQRSRPATEAQGVGPRPAHLRAALEFPVKNRFYAFNCPRSAEFSSEIKIRLPPNSSDDFYLLFTFSHYRASSSPRTAPEKKMDIGYCWLPVCNQSPLTQVTTELLVSYGLPSPEVVRLAKNEVELLNKGLLDTSKFVDPVNTRFLVQTVLVSSRPYRDASVGEVIQSLQPENLSKTLAELNNGDCLRAVVSVITKGRGSCNFAGSGTRSPLLGCLMQAKLQDITLHIGALMDGLLQALGISLVLSPLPDNSVISQSPAANLLAVIAYVVFRVSSGHPDWMEEETQRSRILCGYLAGTSGLTETAALPYFLSGVPLFGMVWKEDVETFIKRSHSQTNKSLPAELLHLIASLLNDRADFLRQIFPWSAWFFLELLARTYIQETVQNKALIIEKPEFCEGLLLLTTKTAQHICSRLAETISASDSTTVAWADALQQLDIRRHLRNSLPNEIGLNRSLAFFLCDAFGFINATIIYQQISTYLGVIDERIQHLTTVDKQEDSDLISPQAANEIRCLVFLKLEFLQIVSSTRDFLSLSLPTDNSRLTQLKTIADADFFRSISPADSILHSPIYRTVHFLPYLILTEVHQCLASPDIQLQEQSMGLLWYCMRNLEASPCDIHLFDRALANCLPDVSLLYLPLLEIACDFAPALLAHWLQEDESDGDGSHKSEGRANSVVPPAGGELGGGTTTTTNDREQLRQMSIQSGRKLTDPAQAGAVERESSGTRCPQSTSEPKSGLSTTKIRTNPTTHFQSILPHFSFSLKHVSKAHQEWSLDSIRRLLLLALWVLHQCRDTLLAEWMLRTGTQMAERLSSLLLLALQYFEYKEPRPDVMEDIHSNVAPHGVSDSNRPHGKDMTPSPPIRCTNTSGRSTTRRPSSFTRDHLVGPPPWQSSRLNETCIENTKLLANTVTSIVCSTLELIIVTFDKPGISQNQESNETDKLRSAKNMLVTSRLLVNISRIHLYGLTRQQCASSFRMLSCGLCSLIGKFPKFFFDEAHALTFSICYVLLSFCSSPLPKIRAMVTAVLYQMFRQCYLLHKHLFFLGCEMTLGVQLHLYGGLQILEDSRSWLKNIDDGPDELQKHKYLTVRGIYAGGQWRIRSIELLPLDMMTSFYHMFEHRTALQSLYLQAAFDALKVYAKSDMVVDVEQRQLETILAHQRRIFHSSCNSGMQYAVLTSQFHAAGGFYTQLSISLETWMEIVACFHHLQGFQTEKISAAATEREHALNLSETILRMATASRLVPELRQNWLLRLAEINLLLNQPAEAAQCLLHILASVVEQLVNRNIWPQFLQTGGASTIADQVLSVNLLEECSVEAAVGLPTMPPCSRFLLRTSLRSREREERAPDSQQSLTGLIGQLHELVEKAVDCLIAADQFEIVTLLCHWLMPILASLGQHERLSKIHELVRATHSAAAASAEERRLCSSYFRVGFYGRKFDELDGREFVYKETPLTKLSEVTARLKEYYDKRFGNSNVFVLKDSKKVNSEDLDEGKLYIQITYVEPYYSQFEARRKATIFGRNYGIKKFLIVTPFTMSGAARGRLTEQYQRNTIITTARTFPYLTTRVEIVAREDVVLSPMEVALQDVIQRNRQLTRALTVHPPDAKFLQMVLQGCVSTTVNQGPLEVARLFLGQSSPRAGTDGQDTVRIKNSLRISLKEFLRKSEEAIDVNRRLIGPDQEEYQQELERSFGEIKRQMSPLLRPNCISRLHSEF